MNKARRKALAEIREQLEVLQDQLMTISEEEEEYRDNIPENLQCSERYEKADQACDALSYACDSLEELISYIEEAEE